VAHIELLYDWLSATSSLAKLTNKSSSRLYDWLTATNSLAKLTNESSSSMAEHNASYYSEHSNEHMPTSLWLTNHTFCWADYPSLLKPENDINLTYNFYAYKEMTVAKAVAQ